MKHVRKRIIFGFFFVLAAVSVFSQTNEEKTVSLEIHNVITNGGRVYISVSTSETSYKNRVPEITFECEPSGNVIQTEITIPIGECVVNIYQDTNQNGKLDNGLFKIPKEPVGISNWNGRSVPGSFEKLKLTVDNTTHIIRVNLFLM